MINKNKIDKILSDALKSSKQGKFSKLTKEEIYFFKKSYGKLPIRQIWKLYNQIFAPKSLDRSTVTTYLEKLGLKKNEP